MDIIDSFIKNKVAITCESKQIPELPNDYIQTDNIGEVIEKLVILHIRMWMLEDQLGIAKTDEEIASLKKKTDICFKIKRPMYVAAINRLIDAAITSEKSLKEESVKLYKGINNA